MLSDGITCREWGSDNLNVDFIRVSSPVCKKFFIFASMKLSVVADKKTIELELGMHKGSEENEVAGRQLHFVKW